MRSALGWFTLAVGASVCVAGLAVAVAEKSGSESGSLLVVLPGIGIGLVGIGRFVLRERE